MDFIFFVVVKFMMAVMHLVFRTHPSKKIASQSLNAFHPSFLALSAKLSVAGARLIFGGGINNILYALCTCEVLEMANCCCA